jgi:hypothetical protein
MFLSDLAQWRVHISGNHVPIESKIIWQPPPAETLRMDEDLKDTILAKLPHCDAAEVHSHIEQKCAATMSTPSKRKISYFMSHLKKRRSERSYQFTKENLEKVLAEDSVCDDTRETMGPVPVGLLVRNSSGSLDVPISPETMSLQYDPENETIVVIQHAKPSGTPVITGTAATLVGKTVTFIQRTDSEQKTYYELTEVEANNQPPSQTLETAVSTPPSTSRAVVPPTETVEIIEECGDGNYYSGVPGAQLMEKAASDMNIQLMKLK